MLVTKYEVGIIVFQIETLMNPDILFICWDIFEPSGRKDLSDPEAYEQCYKIFLYLLSYHAIVF